MKVWSIHKCCREGFNWVLYSKIFFMFNLYIRSCCSVSTVGECSPRRNLCVCLWQDLGESKLFHSSVHFLAHCRKIYSIYVLGVTLCVVDHNHAREFSCHVIVMDTK